MLIVIKNNAENDFVHKNIEKHYHKKTLRTLNVTLLLKKSFRKNRCTFLYSPFEIRLKHIPSFFIVRLPLDDRRKKQSDLPDWMNVAMRISISESIMHLSKGPLFFIRVSWCWFFIYVYLESSICCVFFLLYYTWVINLLRNSVDVFCITSPLFPWLRKL